MASKNKLTMYRTLKVNMIDVEQNSSYDIYKFIVNIKSCIANPKYLKYKEALDWILNSCCENISSKSSTEVYFSDSDILSNCTTNDISIIYLILNTKDISVLPLIDSSYKMYGFEFKW